MEDRIKEVISNILGIEKEAINEGTSVQTVEGWESVSHIGIILALEEEFSVKFDDEDIVEMLSFPIICDKVRNKVTK